MFFFVYVFFLAVCTQQNQVFVDHHGHQSGLSETLSCVPGVLFLYVSYN